MINAAARFVDKTKFYGAHKLDEKENREISRFLLYHNKKVHFLCAVSKWSDH
mgnify:FL=1